MPRIITNGKVDATMRAISVVLRQKLLRNYWQYTNPEDRGESSFEEFTRDLITEVAYRAEFGLDGNWSEFEAQWELPNETYKEVLEQMTLLGFVPLMEKW